MDNDDVDAQVATEVVVESAEKEAAVAAAGRTELEAGLLARAKPTSFVTVCVLVLYCAPSACGPSQDGF